MNRKSIVWILVLAAMVFAVPAMAADKVYNLKMSTPVNRPHPWFDAADYMIKEMDERTGGAVKIRIYGGGQLGTDLSTVDDMRMGTVDMVIGGATTRVSFFPEYGILNMPYFYESIEQFKKVMDPQGPVMNRFREIFEEKNIGVKLLALGGGGTRVFSNNLLDMVEPEQLKGIKMRVPNNPEDAMIWESVGAIVTAMPWNEIYSALQTGVVNAFESTLSAYYGSKFFEVAKHMSNTRHIIMVSDVLISEITWNKLPEEYRAIMLEVADEMAHICTDKGEEYDKEIIQELQEKHGVTVSEVNTKIFMEAFQPLHDKLAARNDNQDLLELLRKTRDEVSK